MWITSALRLWDKIRHISWSGPSLRRHYVFSSLVTPSSSDRFLISIAKYEWKKHPRLPRTESPNTLHLCRKLGSTSLLLWNWTSLGHIFRFRSLPLELPNHERIPGSHAQNPRTHKNMLHPRISHGCVCKLGTPCVPRTLHGCGCPAFFNVWSSFTETECIWQLLGDAHCQMIP